MLSVTLDLVQLRSIVSSGNDTGGCVYFGALGEILDSLLK